MNKRVLFIGGNIYPHQIGGYEVFNYYLFCHLKKIFHTGIINNNKRSSEYLDAEYIQVLNFKPTIIFVTLQYFFYLLFLKEKNNTVIILTYSKSRWLNWWIYPVLKILTGLKYIIVIHGGGLTRWDLPFIHKLLFKKAAEIIGISERICNEYQNRTQKTIRFIPPIIPFRFYKGSKYDAKKKFAIEATEKVILIVGSLKPLKNPQTIIEAAGILGADFIKKHSLKFIFAGDGKLRAELIDKVIQLNLEDKVLFLGNVSRDDIPTLYMASDIYLMASDFEGTPLSLLEALFNSLIVVGSNSPGISNIINNGFNGYLFENKNSTELAKILKTIIISPKIELDKIKENAKLLINESYNYSSIIQQYSAIIDKV